MDAVHGGPDALGVPLFDFSSNGNACGPCPSALAAVRAADAAHYPDPAYTELRQRLAAHHGVDAQRIVLAASASEFIFRVTALAAQRPGAAVYLPPLAYGDYAQAAAAFSLPVTAQAQRASLRWACEPCSPLGAAQGDWPSLRDGLPAPGVSVVLDRAYEPLRLSGLAPPPDVLDAVWQLWTPNKALSLTGVRAAYAVAPLDAAVQTRALNRLCPSWPVGAHGVALLTAWTTPGVQQWLASSLVTLRLYKQQQVAMCTGLGWVCLPGEANFLTAQPDLPTGVTLPVALARLRGLGIKLRDTTSFGLPGHVRLSVQAPAAQKALRCAWQGLVNEPPHRHE